MIFHLESIDESIERVLNNSLIVFLNYLNVSKNNFANIYLSFALSLKELLVWLQSWV